MANIQAEIEKISTAVYGEEVRGAIVNSIMELNNNKPDDTDVKAALSGKANTVEVDMALSGKADNIAISAFKHVYGHMGNDGTWLNLDKNYQHIVIPVNGGDVVVTSFSNVIVLGFVKTYTVPVEGENIDYSEEDGYNAKITTAGKAEKTWTVPSDCTYMIVENISYGTEKEILKLKINGYDLAKTLNKNISDVSIAVDQLNQEVNQDFDIAITDIEQIRQAAKNLTGGIIPVIESGSIDSTTGENASMSTRCRSKDFIEVIGKFDVSFTEDLKITVVYFDETQALIARTSTFTEPHKFSPVDGAKYFRFYIGYTDDRTISEPEMSVIKSDLVLKYCIPSPKYNWFALGDSITQGYYSYLDDSGTPVIGTTKDCWANIVAEKNQCKLTNYGVGGAGFVHEGTVLDKLNARDHVDTIDFSAADVVTIAYGVNDWKYNMNIGTFDDDISTGGTIYSNLRYIIEKILGDNPLAKIIIITPINCSRYGTKENNWGIGYSFSNNGTLEDIYNAEKTVAEYYGLELIDNTHNSVINRITAPSILIDGVHPSLEGHRAMALEIANKINFA